MARAGAMRRTELAGGVARPVSPDQRQHNMSEDASKVTVYEKGTGKPVAAWPIDAREMCAQGTYFYSEYEALGSGPRGAARAAEDGGGSLEDRVAAIEAHLGLAPAVEGQTVVSIGTRHYRREKLVVGAESPADPNSGRAVIDAGRAPEARSGAPIAGYGVAPGGNAIDRNIAQREAGDVDEDPTNAGDEEGEGEEAPARRGASGGDEGEGEGDTAPSRPGRNRIAEARKGGSKSGSSRRAKK